MTSEQSDPGAAFRTQSGADFLRTALARVSPNISGQHQQTIGAAAAPASDRVVQLRIAIEKAIDE